MAVRTRIDPIDRDIVALISRDLSPEAQSKALAAFAREHFIEAEAQNIRVLGAAPDHDTFVDGRQGAALETVKPDGTILVEFHLLTDVIEFVDAQLILNSPVKSGTFMRSHVWFADDVEFDPAHPPVANSYVVLNAQPYARKLERGASSQAPDGVYQAVAAVAKRRFGNVAFVGFTYRSFPGGAVGNWAQTESAKTLARNVRGGRPDKHHDWLTRQPAISIDQGR